MGKEIEVKMNHPDVFVTWIHVHKTNKHLISIQPNLTVTLAYTTYIALKVCNQTVRASVHTPFTRVPLRLIMHAVGNGSFNSEWLLSCNFITYTACHSTKIVLSWQQLHIIKPGTDTLLTMVLEAGVVLGYALKPLILLTGFWCVYITCSYR